MSLESVIGQIDQIMQMQQQLFGGVSSTTSGTTGGVAAAGTGTTSPAGGVASDTAYAGSSATSAQNDFASALADAQSAMATPSALASPDSSLLGSGAALVGGTSSDLLDTALPTSTAAGLLTSTPPSLLAVSGSTAGSTLPAPVQAMITEANSLIGMPYVWGGGHSGFGPQTGYDCSGFVSAVLHAGGYLTAPQDTQTLPSAPGIEPGPGQYVTIYDRTDAGSGDDHVIIDIAGQFYESGGEAGSWGGGGGVQPIAAPSAAYLATFNQILHPAGL